MILELKSRFDYSIVAASGTRGALKLGECDVSLHLDAQSAADRERSSPADQDVAHLLTMRQLEIPTWVQEGKSAWEIGRILGISFRSVDGHLRRIYTRLDVHTRLQAVLRARDLGLLQRPTRRG